MLNNEELQKEYYDLPGSSQRQCKNCGDIVDPGKTCNCGRTVSIINDTVSDEGWVMPAQEEKELNPDKQSLSTEINEAAKRIQDLYDDIGANKKSALGRQVGGSHYKNWEIQPFEFIFRNKLAFWQGCVIKRIMRWDRPGGKYIEDLDKAIHEIEMVKEMIQK